MSEFKKRSGSTIRDVNIRAVMKKLKDGESENDVLTELAMCFCQDTRVDYLNTAKEMLKFERKNGITDNLVKEEKPQIQPKIEKEQDFTLDLTDFIKSNHYEKLSDSELIEKISMLKNEKLKTNWINQIKKSPESSKGEK